MDGSAALVDVIDVVTAVIEATVDVITDGFASVDVTPSVDGSDVAVVVVVAIWSIIVSNLFFGATIGPFSIDGSSKMIVLDDDVVVRAKKDIQNVIKLKVITKIGWKNSIWFNE